MEPWMRDANTISGRPNSEGSSIYPVYPKTSATTTIRHIVGLERVIVAAILFLLALCVWVGSRHSDFVQTQISNVKARMSASEADRHAIHKVIDE
jgi:hypothetical protein